MTTSQESYDADNEGYLSENQRDAAELITKLGGAAGAGALAGGPVGLAATGAGTAIGLAGEHIVRNEKGNKKFERDINDELRRNKRVGETFDRELYQEQREEFDGDMEAAEEEYGKGALGIREQTIGEKAKNSGRRILPFAGAGVAVDTFGDEAYQAATEYGMEIMDTAANSAPEVAGAGAAAALGGVGALKGWEKVKDRLNRD